MIILLVFSIHVIFLIFVFARTLKLEDKGTAIQNVVFIIIIFSVGWTFVSLVINMFVSPIGFGKHFDRSTISLVLLALGETYFYYYYIRNRSTISDDTEIQ